MIKGNRTLAGPAAPLRDYIAVLADSCWLLRGRLSGGAELTYRGRPARQLRVTSAHGGEEPVLGLMVFPADAIVDAETGCLLRLISYAGGTLVIWPELDDISTEAADLYIGYFENRYGEQWIFTFDRATRAASLRGGDAGRATAHPVRDGRVDGLILAPEETAWLQACWSATRA